MEIKDIYIGLIISFVLVLTLWVLQIFFRKMKILCFCSTVSLIVVVVSEVLAELSPNNELLIRLVSYVLFPGFRIVILFANPWLVVHHQKGLFLWYVFSVIFYSVVFWGIAEGISYARRKYFCRKTN